jgi:hypothetical protein
VFNETNSGSTFKQWNKGAAHAIGEYLWFAESDDSADPRLLETLVGKLESNKSCGIAYCQSFVVDENDQVLGTRQSDADNLDPRLWAADFIANGPELVAKFLLRTNFIPNASAVLMRKSLYMKVGGADEKLRLVGDWKLYASILSKSDLAFVHEPLNYFRQHTQTVRSETRQVAALIERYHMLAFIRKVVTVPYSNVRKRSRELAEQWVYLLDERRMTVSAFCELFWAAQRADIAAAFPAAWLWLRRVGGRWRRRLGLHRVSRPSRFVPR